jgi:hypothetical protein
MSAPRNPHAPRAAVPDHPREQRPSAESRAGSRPGGRGTPSRIAVDADVLRRIEANMAWLIRAARPSCGSEPESYDLDNAAAAHADLQRILAGVPADSD